ncbi:PREDICTED: Fanconi anemia group B protein [Tinamus guttatus]|uniref:Fanconi anemia group B protein n=1 Tax=Tinamus guttatus TaxID=94827 RepID=UPI00052F0E2B|nr:PREDICTED: Fanconi anemia group B protein [Tinamus guttatus]
MLLHEQEQVLSYNGEVLVFQLSGPKHMEGAAGKTTNLSVRRMAFDRDTKLFIQKSSGVFSMHGNPLEAEIICCSSTTDSRSGLVLPCVLVKKKKRKNVLKYLLLLLHSSNRFEQCFHFKLDYELREDVRLFAGPSVLWRHDSRLFHVSRDACAVRSAPLQLSSVVWAGETGEEGVLVLGVRAACSPESEDEPEFSTSDGAIWGSEFFAYAIETQKIMSGTSFMPHAYSRVVSSVCVCKNEVLRKQLRISLVAVTQKNQLVWFQDGLPKGVCELPYEKPCSVKTAVTTSNNMLFIVSFASGNTCAIWRDSFQVASKWQKVNYVLVDDFIGSGTEQMLLLFKDDSCEDVLSTFRISDFGEINYASGINYKDDTPRAEGLQENSLLTVQALETRLQAGYTSIRELQHHLRLKKKVILESCRALIDLVQERSHILPTAEKEGLVSLWDDTENPLHSLNKEASMTAKVPEHFVEKLWQRVVDDRLIVGVKLAESFSLSLSDVSLSLVVDPDVTLISPIIECQNKIITLNKAFSALAISSCQIEPPPKKMKLDFDSKNDLEEDLHKRSLKNQLDRAKTFIAVTSLSPLLAFHSVRCTVLLHAKKPKHQRDGLQNSKKITLLCGKILLSLEDISQGKYSVKMLRDNSYCTGSLEDILAVLAASIRFSFQIVSSEYTLTPVNSWLLGEMECTPFKEYHKNLVCQRMGNLHGTVLSWTQKSPFEGVLTLFCRNMSVLFQCLHSLTGALPPSTDIRLLRSGSKDRLTDQLALALEKEVLISRNSFSSKENEVEKSGTWGKRTSKKISDAPVAPFLDSKEGVQQFRKKLQHEREESILSMNQAVNGALYQKMALKMAEAQLHSDMIVWRLSRS